MSGQQIGTVIGGAIGAYFGAGNPAAIQLGMAIGGAIGGAVDPTHINGPKIGDGQQQSATDGNPIAWVQGAAMVAGTIVQVSSRRQIRHKDNGKGGPVTVTFTAEQDFAILICESCESRDSSMSAVLMVLQDGKLVYDVRPGSTILADSYKWKANVDFLYGGEGQLPHPTLEAITGVGNTPAYRGSMVAVFKNFDVSQAGDRIPTFQFVVSSDAVTAPLVKWAKSFHQDPGPTFSVKLSGISEGDLLVLFVGYALLFNTDELGLPAGWTVQNSNTAGNAGRWVCLTKVAEASDVGTPITFTGSLIRYYGGWMCNAYCVAAESYAIETLDYALNTLSGSPPPLTLGGGGGAVFFASSYETGAADWTNGSWPGADCQVSTKQQYQTYFTGEIDTARMDSCAQTVPTTSSAWGPHFQSNRWASALGVSRNAAAGGATPSTLQSIASAVCKRGGLEPSDFDVSALPDITVAGYPIARQANAADCLMPLLQAYFGYASEYDAQLHFMPYGADASVLVDRADLIEGNDANNGAIVSNLRNQSTEFPRRVVGSYMDPAQNYTVVDVSAERRAVDVIAIGDRAFQIPVVMAADDAAKAVDKALKVAYATLEGTLEYSVPFADADVYLGLAAGEPLQFHGKRYVLDELILGNGNLKLTTRYDRQSAYTSSVQAILGNAPVPPASPYSGPTTLYAMNLPAQRPQDTVGVYMVAAGSLGQASWAGCTVQVSYDGLATWQNALQIRTEGTLGTVALAEPLTVDVLKYDLENATPAQLTAMANVFAITSATGLTQLGQFSTATETTPDKRYELTGVARPLGGTTSSPIAAGNTFALMDAAYFLPIDLAFAGHILYFRAVGFGEIAEDADVVSLVYTALLPNEGSQLITEDGAFDFVTESGLLTFRSE